MSNSDCNASFTTSVLCHEYQTGMGGLSNLVCPDLPCDQMIKCVCLPPALRSSLPVASRAALYQCSPSTGGWESDKNCRRDKVISTLANNITHTTGDVVTDCVAVKCMFAFMIRTRFLSVLRSSHSDVGVWTVREEMDTEHPFLMDFGRRTKNLRRRWEQRNYHTISMQPTFNPSCSHSTTASLIL